MTALDSGRPPGGERVTPKKAAELLALLRERHPVIRNGLPLAVGIHQPIHARYPEFNKTVIRRALQFHTCSRAYLIKLAAGGHCYDLAGHPWDLITPKHQRQAQEQLAAKCKPPTQNPRPSPTFTPPPPTNPGSNVTPIDTGHRADCDAVALRLKGIRPQLTLKRNEERP